MATVTTYSQVGVAESVEDLIHDISPTSTPFLSSIKSEKVSARQFSWIEDALAATSATNARVEGWTAADTGVTTPVERSNDTQIIGKNFVVTGTADAIKTYGRAKETAYQLSKALKEVKLDYEAACLSDTTESAGDASTARQMTAIDEQITESDAVTTNLGEGDITALGQKCYDAGSEPSLLLINGAQAANVAGFAAQGAGQNRTINDGSKTFVNVIELLVTPFGEYRVVLSRQCPTTRAFLIDPTMFKACTLRPFSRTLLAKTGDFDSHMVVGEVSVKHNSYADSGKFIIS